MFSTFGTGIAAIDNARVCLHRAGENTLYIMRCWGLYRRKQLDFIADLKAKMD